MWFVEIYVIMQFIDASESLVDVVGRLNRDAHGVLDITARLRLVRALVPGRHCLTTSFGIEDQLLTACAADLEGAIEIVTLETGRLFAETHAVWKETEQRYGITIASFAPSPQDVIDLEARDGRDGFYESVTKRHACCDLRKTEPLARALQGTTAWITGLRSEQSPERSKIAFAAIDPQRGIVKISPLHDWTRGAVVAELQARKTPISQLEGRGYRSIGCEPCTRATRPEEPERAGRWWWESEGGAKECGLHVAANTSLGA